MLAGSGHPHADEMRPISQFQNNTTLLVSVRRSDAAHLLDRDLNQIGRLPLDPGNVTATSLDSQGTGLVAGSARGTVQLWDLRLRRSRGTWEEARGSSLAVRAVAGSPAQPAVWYVASRAGTIWTLVRIVERVKWRGARVGVGLWDALAFALEIGLFMIFKDLAQTQRPTTCTPAFL